MVHVLDCQSANDVFGPAVDPTCNGGFDFTLLFEESILTLLPLCIAVLCCIVRIHGLRGLPFLVRGSWLLLSKTIAYVMLFTLQVILCGFWQPSRIPQTRLTTAALVMTAIAVIPLILTSFLEHIRSPRPSTLLVGYLGLSILFDAVRIRTVLAIAYSPLIPAITISVFCVKVFIFLLENCGKRSLMFKDGSAYPAETIAGIMNRAFFLWLNPLLLRGYRAQLSVDTLMAIDTAILSASRPIELKDHWSIAHKSSRFALLRLFLLHYKWQILTGVLPRLALIGFQFAQPLLIDTTLAFIDVPSETRSSSTGYALIGAYFLVYMGIAISFTLYEHQMFRLLTIYRGSLISMIYDKMLLVKHSEIPDAEAITLMSADIDRIGQTLNLIHDWYASLIELGIGLWLLYLYLGLAMAASTGFIIVFLLVTIPIASAAGKAQKPWLEAIELRLAATVSFVNTLKDIKMAGYAPYVDRLLRSLRQREIAASYRYRLLDAIVNVSFHCCSQIGPLIGLAVYALLYLNDGNPQLDQGTAFAALSLFSLLDAPFSTLLSSVEHFQTLSDCFERIQDHLISQECDQNPSIELSQQGSLPRCTSSIQRGSSVEYLDSKTQSTFHRSDVIARFENLSVTGTDGELTILEDIDLEIVRGKMTLITGSTGCGKSALLKTLLSEMTVSAGTMERSFTSAAFCSQTPWVMGGTIRDNIIGMSPWDDAWFATIVHGCDLVKDFNDLPDGMNTLVGQHGSRLSGGQRTRVALARALYSRKEILILDDVLNGLDAITEKHLVEHVFSETGLLRQFNRTTIIATNSSRLSKHADFTIVLDKSNHPAAQGLLRSQLTSGESESIPGEITAPEKELQRYTEMLQLLPGTIPVSDEIDGARKSGDFKVYFYYIRLAGFGTCFCYLLLCATFVAGIYVAPVWVQRWTEKGNSHGSETLSYWLGIYAAIALVAVMASFNSDLLFKLVMVPRTAVKFHEVLLSTTLNATAAFLSTAETGTIINRFSQDLELIDNDLPSSFDATIVQLIGIIPAAVLIFNGSGYLAAAVPLCILVLYFLQSFYLKTSRQIRLLDIEAKAPLFAHFLETSDGLLSIRSYGWTLQYRERLVSALDTSQKPYYLLWCIQRWLALVLNLVVAALAVLLIGLATNVYQGSTAYLGVALFNIVAFSSDLENLVVGWTELETAIGATARIRSYGRSTEHEDEQKVLHNVPKEWPLLGNVVVSNARASYGASQTPALNHLNIVVEAKSKIAICGRTGSGKSSFVAALLGTLPLESGSIVIDGLDICNIPNEKLRSRLITIPQTSFILPGTVRENIVQHWSASIDDTDIIRVFDILDLWNLIRAHGGLDVEANHIPFSEGQRQLLGLARARFSSGTIVVLDEFNSSLDSSVESRLQPFLRSELFLDRTVIAIVHKVKAVLDFDQVLVMEDGLIVERGEPEILLHTPGSRFRQLYAE